MFNTALLIGVIGLYLASTALIANYVRKSATASEAKPNSISMAFNVGATATLLHLVFAYQFCIVNGVLNFSLGSMSVLISGLLCFIYVLGGLSLPIRRLGLIVFPLTIISLLFAQLWGKVWGSNEFIPLSNSSLAASAHVIISILAYCLLAIAAIQAILYVYQERQLKKHASPAVLMAMPPLQTMEILLFRLIWTGFILLTFTLLSGALFSHEIYRQPFEFKHHTILATLGWFVFTALLSKRHLQGLRGTQAMYWTVGGFLLIQLGYFGTKVVSESLSVQ